MSTRENTKGGWDGKGNKIRQGIFGKANKRNRGRPAFILYEKPDKRGRLNKDSDRGLSKAKRAAQVIRLTRNGRVSMSTKLLNNILHFGKQKRQYNFTQPTPHLKLVFKEGAIQTIKNAKGWRTDAEMGRFLGVTRSYITMMKNRRISVSHSVILRIAYLMNNTDAWWHFYEIIDAGQPVDPNNPLWNMEKYRGTMPYDNKSTTIDFRRKDYQAEGI